MFTDIDDTITRNGLLTASAFQSLWDLHDAGIEVIVVTGRPAGWCDHIARMWPVSAVVGENGAFVYSYNRERKKMERLSLISETQRLDGKKRLERIRERVLREVPGCGIAADQTFRLTDLAVDYCEDVEPLSREKVERICHIAESEGAACKISSIHVNCWYGDFDKVSGVRKYLESRKLDLEDSEVQVRIVFTGDSPNDEPMFEALNYTIAVANIRPYLKRLNHPPRYITEKKAAAGFTEAVRIILGKRRA